MRVHAPDEPVVAQMDTVRVERIVRNVLVNALEHAEGTPIDITVAGNEGAVAVRVRDHGVGMTPEVASKVFDRFYRAAPSCQRTLGGTGLGLSISAEDAVLHGGTLEVWGWPDEGVSFLAHFQLSVFDIKGSIYVNFDKSGAYYSKSCKKENCEFNYFEDNKRLFDLNYGKHTITVRAIGGGATGSTTEAFTVDNMPVSIFADCRDNIYSD